MLKTGEASFTDDEAEYVQAVGNIVSSAVQRHQAEARLAHLAQFDSVTGLANRNAFLDQVDAAIHAARWDERAVALFALDFRRIAEIKTSMGFGAGDTLAMAIAARLTAARGEGESVAHLGETEFALMLEASGTLTEDGLRQRALRLVRGYRPERYYMRGPGPKGRAL